MKIRVIGGGLAGSEAAYYIANKGYKVILQEMRPNKKALAHHSDKFGELVCSNSLKSKDICNAAGLLKKEMETLSSLIMEAAYHSEVGAGQALAVDREKFQNYITEKIINHPNIEIVREEATSINDDEISIVCSGPLTSDTFSQYLKEYLGNDYYYFYDAAAPLLLKDGIDFNIAYYKSRYDKGDADYINLPFTKEEFFTFYHELVNATRVELKSFEKEIHFESCMPIEVMAKRGYKTLTFGPLKPVGLEKDGVRPFAVVQLRQDNVNGDMYNIVGFQTNLTFKEQERVFKLIPGLKDAKFVRYGVMHRNTYINSPKLLSNNLNLKDHPNVFFAGQIIGVEGYIESACSGIIAGINAIRYLNNLPLNPLPKETVIGALLNYISFTSGKNFQPMNANYGVLNSPLKDKEEIANLSLLKLKEWINENA